MVIYVKNKVFPHWSILLSKYLWALGLVPWRFCKNQELWKNKVKEPVSRFKIADDQSRYVLCCVPHFWGLHCKFRASCRKGHYLNGTKLYTTCHFLLMQKVEKIPGNVPCSGQDLPRSIASSPGNQAVQWVLLEHRRGEGCLYSSTPKLAAELLHDWYCSLRVAAALTDFMSHLQWRGVVTTNQTYSMPLPLSAPNPSFALRHKKAPMSTTLWGAGVVDLPQILPSFHAVELH